MIFSKPLPFVSIYIEALNEAIAKHKPGAKLSLIQRSWLSLCIMAILLTNSVCWARFERASLGMYSLAALSWMFRHSRIPWEMLFVVSTKHILEKHGIKMGILDLDDSDRKRSKVAPKIGYLHKLKDKTSGGFMMGQCIVFLILVTEVVTIPVGFSFYVPDPELSKWNKLNEKLKKLHVPPAQRPPRPARDKDYPTKQDIALTLLAQFKVNHPDVRVKAILADALYGTEDFVNGASALFESVQVVSELRNNQNVRYKNKQMHVSKYFAKHPGTPFKVRIRAGAEIGTAIGSARLYVCAHGKKRFVIALKYEGEDEYRYLVASDLSWRTQDIVEAYTFRWLVEVFFEDWKSYEGWGQLTKHPGKEGSSQSLILSLLTDHCLLFHPEQIARLKNKLPAYTVGSLQARVRVDSLLSTIRDILDSDDPEDTFEQLKQSLKELFTLNISGKHMVGRELGRLDPTPALKYRAVT
jgi:hypothetical protein